MPPPIDHPWLQVGQINEVTVVKFTHRELLNDAEIDTVGDLLTRLPEAGCTKIVIDLASVYRMTSAMVGKFVALREKVRAADGRLVLCGLQPPIAEVFRILQLLPLFTVCANQRQAVTSF
jgi:anti-anti-sigma factor